MQLDAQPGVIIKQLKVHDLNTITLDVLRDPDAIKISDWLNTNAINSANVKVIERNYYSLDTPILHQRIERISANYPRINFTWKNNMLALAGTLNISKTEQLLNALGLAGFTVDNNLDTAKLQLTSSNAIAESKQIQQQLFNDIIGRVASLQLNFPVAIETITPEMQMTLQKIYQYVKQLTPLAKSLNIKFGLLILGSSDNTGSSSTNNIISLQRANNAADVLQQHGMEKTQMFVVGLGKIEISEISSKARTVMFNIIHINNN